MVKGRIETLIDDRAQHLLRVLVQRYIREGQPVGSRTLSRDSGLDLSPATIRNVMADLEDLGLVRAPHTSAGRVPTVSGFRFFIDSLLRTQPLEESEVDRLRQELHADREPGDLMRRASSLLSEVTHLAGLVTLPRRDQLRLRHVEFLPLSGRRVLVVLVVNDREVQNRVIQTGRRYTESELQQAANYLNVVFGGKDLHEARVAVLGEMQAERESMNRMMLAAIEMADKAFTAEECGDDYVLAGQTKLMEFAELGDMEKMRHLFDAFNEKRRILHLLDKALHADGMQIFIGDESGYEVLGDLSVVTAPYTIQGKVVGVLGVIGPTRMAYDRVIPIVDLTAKLLGSALNETG
jgi:heat-inducible transcriptional repressor